MKENIFEDVRIYLPKYLSAEDQKKLFSELKSFPENINKKFFSHTLKNTCTLCQGDGLTSVPMAYYDTQEFIPVKSLLLSNSCDISMDNQRKYQRPYITFSPMFNLKEYEKVLLEDHPKARLSVKAHIESIRKQEITSFFYLPENDSTTEEYFARLDCVFSINSDSAITDIQQLIQKRLFTLSNYGFYLLLLKIAIHFSRMQENVNRS